MAKPRMTAAADALRTRPPATSRLSAWLPSLGAVAVACVAVVLIFRSEIDGAVRVWTESTAYNHGFLVLPLFAVLLWLRRDVIVALRPRPCPWALMLLPPLAVLWTGAVLADVLEAQQLLVVALFEALLLAVLGWTVFRALLAPLLFLFFLVPFGAFLVPALQQLTAVMAVAGLQFAGIPVYADGVMLQIPAGKFEVAEACAGLRFVIASLVFGWFFATIVYRSYVRRALFVLLSAVVPVLANGLRVLGLLFLAHLNGNAAAALADHVLYGWLFFAIVTLLLIMVGMSFADHPVTKTPPQTTAATSASSGLRTGLTAAGGLLILVAAPTYLMTLKPSAAAPPIQRTAAQPALSEGVFAPTQNGDWKPVDDGASHESIETYRVGDVLVTRFVALYALPARRSPLTRNTNHVIAPAPWQAVGTATVKASFAGGPLSVNAVTLVQRSRMRIAWSFYIVDGIATSDRLEVKLLQLRSVFSGPHVGALVVMSVETDDPNPDNPALARSLAMLSLQDVISAATDSITGTRS